MIQPSNYQRAIYDFVRSGDGHGVISAVPGSGKTTTLVGAVGNVPSHKAVRFLAFNKHIVQELKLRMPNRDVSTLHSLGYLALRQAGFGKRAGKNYVDTRKYRKLAKNWITPRAKLFADQFAAESTLFALVDQARLRLWDLANMNASGGLAWAYRCDIDVDRKTFGDLWPGVTEVIKRGQDIAEDTIDFTDQLYLPIALDLAVPDAAFVFVDETQDLSRLQLELALRAVSFDGRMLACGDPRQFIFAFAGADPDSMDQIIRRTSATMLPLSICYRCPVLHIELANSVWPGIEAAPNAIDGEIEHDVDEGDIARMVQAGDLVVCRVNAPLIPLCFDLIRRGIAAKVRGRDIGSQLKAALKRAVPEHAVIEDAPRYIVEYLTLQRSILIESIEDDATRGHCDAEIDRAETLLAIIQGRRPYSFEELHQTIDDLFADDVAAVWLSSIHRAKGLEADRVFIVRHDLIPHPRARSVTARVQESNLQYVAYTRAKKALYISFETAVKVEELVFPQQPPLFAMMGGVR